MVTFMVAMVRWAAGLGYPSLVVHPSDSYLWPVLDSSNPPAASAELDCTSCMFGSAHRGATRIRVFGDIALEGLAKACRRTPSGWSCGNRSHAISAPPTRPGRVAWIP